MTVHIRKLRKDEMEQWVKAIHVVCDTDWVPALRAAFSHLMPFVDEDCPTAYTDCQYRIGIGPHLLDPQQTTLDQLATTILHETLHNTQHHRQRLYEKRGLNGKLCNFAADLEINSLITQGVHNINLSREPDIQNNGHWEKLIGKLVILDAKEAANINAQKDENGRPIYPKTYQAGDTFYNGILLPKQGQFHDFPDNYTAEQYLGLLEVDIEDMTLGDFMEKMQDHDENSSSAVSGGEDGQDQGTNDGVDDNTDANNGNSIGDGAQGTSGTQGANGTGATKDASDSASAGAVHEGAGFDGAGANEQDSYVGDGTGIGTGAGSAGGGGNAYGAGGSGIGSDTGVPSGSGIPGSVQGAGTGSNGSDNGTYQDGYGGEARDLGDGHVSVTHIYKRNGDGTRTEVGRDNLVDDLGKHADDEVWKEASRLGIDPISRTEEQKVRDQIAHDIELQRKSNGYGSGAGNMLLNYIERGLRPPLVDWKRMLRHVVTRACQEQTKGRTDYTYRRINRRYSQGEFIFPGMTTYIPSIRFALDTSGSMSADEYYNAFSEAEGILKYAKAKIDFVCWDGMVTNPKQVKDLKEMKSSLQGGGGTDPVVVVDQIEKEKERTRPDVLVVATDGCFNWDAFAESLNRPAMQNIVPIVLIVYKFGEDAYYNKQKELPALQKQLRQYHKKATVLQAWSKARS